jgi:glycerol uptake facilitator-like aquaporin
MLGPELPRRVVAEALGTALLVAVVVGSGIMAERLAHGDVAVALLANTLATGAGLYAIITAFGPVSGAHLNPVVTLAMAWKRSLQWRDVAPYVVAQIAGGSLGALAANTMFDEPLVSFSTHARNGGSQLFSEAVAAFGLLTVIWAVSRRRGAAVPGAVAAYIMAAYWFTASTSFANPAVTIARSLSNTFAGIRPADVLGFVVAQLIGALAATLAIPWLVPVTPSDPGSEGKRP